MKETTGIFVLDLDHLDKKLIFLSYPNDETQVLEYTATKGFNDITKSLPAVSDQKTVFASFIFGIVLQVSVAQTVLFTPEGDPIKGGSASHPPLIYATMFSNRIVGLTTSGALICLEINYQFGTVTDKSFMVTHINSDPTV
jgi:hypothetical protein